MGSEKIDKDEGIFLECVHCKKMMGCKLVKEKQKDGCLFLEERDQEHGKKKNV